MPMLIQPEPGKPKPTGIKLYVYGFPAAQRRAPCALAERTAALPAAEGENRRSACRQRMQLPVSVEFLGLLDTVASVGWRMWCRLPTGICPGQTARWSCRMMKPMAG